MNWKLLSFFTGAIQYGDAGAFDLGEGLYAPDPQMGSSLTRDLFGSDTGDNRTDFQVSTPTPGTGRALASVPEPGTELVLVFGLLGLAAIGRAPSARRGGADKKFGERTFNAFATAAPLTLSLVHAALTYYDHRKTSEASFVEDEKSLRARSQTRVPEPSSPVLWPVAFPSASTFAAPTLEKSHTRGGRL